MAELILNGASLHFSDVGSGSPVFLFIHGWGCDHACWSAQVADLSNEYRCIAVDLRGRGASQAIPPFGVGQALEDVAALIRALELPPVILVGHSLGGIIALALNGRYPDLVFGIVTIDSRRDRRGLSTLRRTHPHRRFDGRRRGFRALL